jgi:hypothetical protein
MEAIRDCPPPTFGAGDKQYGFHIQQIEQIREIMVTVYGIEH